MMLQIQNIVLCSFSIKPIVLNYSRAFLVSPFLSIYSFKKMARVLQSGSSVVLFPKGAYNNSENQLIMLLFSSPYILSKELGIEVVPMISFNDSGSDKIYIRAGNPMNLAQYEKYETMAVLRNIYRRI